MNKNNVKYLKIPIIRPGLIFVQKAFFLGLFSGEPIFGVPWVPEVCLARFPVSVNVSIVTHEAGREKPLAPRVFSEGLIVGELRFRMSWA